LPAKSAENFPNHFLVETQPFSDPAIAVAGELLFRQPQGM
jgi:hypothetical protein